MSALIAERNIETATAHGELAEELARDARHEGDRHEDRSSTSVMAMIGAVISAMARFVASRGESSGCSSITRSTFSDHHDGVVDDDAMASTMASSETEFAE